MYIKKRTSNTLTLTQQAVGVVRDEHERRENEAKDGMQQLLLSGLCSGLAMTPRALAALFQSSLYALQKQLVGAYFSRLCVAFVWFISQFGGGDVRRAGVA